MLVQAVFEEVVPPYYSLVPCLSYNSSNDTINVMLCIGKLRSSIGVRVYILHNSSISGHGSVFIYNGDTYLEGECHGVGACSWSRAVQLLEGVSMIPQWKEHVLCTSLYVLNSSDLSDSLSWIYRF